MSDAYLSNRETRINHLASLRGKVQNREEMLSPGSSGKTAKYWRLGKSGRHRPDLVQSIRKIVRNTGAFRRADSQIQQLEKRLRLWFVINDSKLLRSTLIAMEAVVDDRPALEGHKEARERVHGFGERLAGSDRKIGQCARNAGCCKRSLLRPDLA